MVALVSRPPPLAWGVLLVLAAAAALAVALPGQRLWVASAAPLALIGGIAWAVVSPASQRLGPAGARAPHDRPEVALTFDDGPDPAATPALLDLLAERGAPATFFLVGERARAHPDLVRRIVAEGHLVANHSDRHALTTNFFGVARLRAELTACQETLTALAGAPPRYYRPPVGLMNHAVAPVCRALGLEVVGWSVRSLDTTRRTVEAVLARVRRGLRPGAIVLLHDGGQEPERARAIAAAVLESAAEAGLEPVRLDRLLGGPAPHR